MWTKEVGIYDDLDLSKEQKASIRKDYLNRADQIYQQDENESKSEAIKFFRDAAKDQSDQSIAESLERYADNV